MRFCSLFRAFVCCGIFIFNVSGGAHGQGQLLSLQDAIREALQNNNDLKSAFQNKLMASADTVTAALRQNPSLTLIGDVLPSSGERLNPGDKYYGASLSVPLDLWNRRTKRMETASEAYANAGGQFNDAVRQLRLAVAQVFYTVLALRDRLELAHQNLFRLGEFVKLNKIRAEQQEIAGIDVIRSEFARVQYEQDVQSVTADYQAAIVGLQVLLGRKPLADTLALASDVEDVVSPDTMALEDAFTLALHRRPDYQALVHQLESDKANVRLQQAIGVPDMSISGDFSQQQGQKFYGLSLNFTLPLFNRNQGEVEKSAYRVTQDELQLLSLEAKIRAAIHTAQHDMLRRWNLVKQQREALLPQAERILKTIEYSYRSGTTTLLDYLDAQRTFNDTRISYIQTLLSYHLSQTSYQSAIGQEQL